jgi:hypothetical protein
MCVYFDGLYIPQGAVMFLYSSDRKTFVGPFTVDDCNPHGSFMMGEVLGDDAVLEYYEPASVVGVPSIGIQSVSHMYRYVYNYSDFSTDDASRIDESDACEVDVNCPEGADWIPQRDAVVRLLISDGGSQGLCSRLPPLHSHSVALWCWCNRRRMAAMFSKIQIPEKWMRNRQCAVY